MKILLTGATGYIGKRLLPELLDRGHEVVCCVRDHQRFPTGGIYNHPKLFLYVVDFLEDTLPSECLEGMEAAYYLIHAMSSKSAAFEQLEEKAARNFISLVSNTAIKQIVYLGGIANEARLSRHLASRRNVEEILRSSGIALTAIRAGIIVGSGSASFEIIRDIVEKLPVIIGPKWLRTRCQPVAIRNVLQYLTGVLMNPATFNESYDIGGPDILSYREMLAQFAEVRGLRRFIFTVPVMTPRLSSYWLYFITSTSYPLACNLVDSMRVEVIARDRRLDELLGVEPISYRDAVNLAFRRIEQNNVISSWKDALASSFDDNSLLKHIHVPCNGCCTDTRMHRLNGDEERVLHSLWSIGGERGWYYGNWLWQLRGFLDRLVGGVGLRRGRTHPHEIHTGDTLDFWRVLAADKPGKRLLLYAEMKLPGEAWLEFRIIDHEGHRWLKQVATFRPKGLLGRLYWYSVLPFHFFIFGGMLRNIVAHSATAGEPGGARQSDQGLN